MKKGQRATHRVRYEWANGVNGTKAFMSLSDAETFDEQLVTRAYDLDTEVAVTIEEI